MKKKEANISIQHVAKKDRRINKENGLIIFILAWSLTSPNKFYSYERADGYYFIIQSLVNIIF